MTTSSTGPGDGSLTILILGGSGFIGTNLAAQLAQRGHRVIATGRADARAGAEGGDTQAGASITNVSTALADVDAIAAIVESRSVDRVIHLASALKPASSLADYLAERETVLTPTFALAEVLAQRSIPLVYFSSGGTVYGAGTGECAHEDDPLAPISYYGHSKLETEEHLRFLHRTRNLPYLIVRPSNPYGPGQSLTGNQGLVSVLLGKIAGGRGLDVWGDGSTVRDYIHIADLCHAVCALIEGEPPNSAVNVGSGIGHTLLDVVGIVERVVGQEVPLSFKPARQVDVPRLVLDIGRLKALGLADARPLETGIRDYARQLGMLGG